MFAGHSYEALCHTATSVHTNKVEFRDKNNWSSSFEKGTYASLLAQNLGYDCDVGSSDAGKIACHLAVFPNFSYTKLQWRGTDPNSYGEGNKHVAVENGKKIVKAKK